MTVKELQQMAKGFGIKTTGLRKAELVKTIQSAERNFDCFDTATLVELASLVFLVSGSG